jgi:signal transduction histidine kinase
MVKALPRRLAQWSAAAAALRRTAAVASDPRARPWLTDAAISAAVTGASLWGTAAIASWHHGPRLNIADLLLLIASGASLTARRRYPGTVLGVTLAAALVCGLAGQSGFAWLPVIVALFAAVRARRRAAVLASLVIGYLSAVWPPWLIGSRGHTSATLALTLLSGLLVLLSAAELMRAAVERRLASHRIREQEVLRLASEERMRIARDLHDIVAHNISVINVQANTALHLVERQPERAQQALATINDISRQALAELRLVLGILRADGEAAPRAPAPGLGELGTLLANIAAAGLTVEFETEGTPVALPASVDLAAYRIIQEALTNSARHSGGTRATVRVHYRSGDVEIEVDDEGTTGQRSPQLAGTGSGIAGMTDRAEALGGRLTAGPRSDVGFRVTAVLPVSGGDQ